MIRVNLNVSDRISIKTKSELQDTTKTGLVCNYTLHLVADIANTYSYPADTAGAATALAVQDVTAQLALSQGTSLLVGKSHFVRWTWEELISSFLEYILSCFFSGDQPLDDEARKSSHEVSY